MTSGRLLARGWGAWGPSPAGQKAGPISWRPTENGTISGELRENSAGLGLFAATEEAGPGTGVQRCKREPRHTWPESWQEETVEAGEAKSRLELSRKCHQEMTAAWCPGLRGSRPLPSEPLSEPLPCLRLALGLGCGLLPVLLTQDPTRICEARGSILFLPLSPLLPMARTCSWKTASHRGCG